jgi:hypothetical protein
LECHIKGSNDDEMYNEIRTHFSSGSKAKFLASLGHFYSLLQYIFIVWLLIIWHKLTKSHYIIWETKDKMKKIILLT